MSQNPIPAPPRFTEKVLKHIFPDEGIFSTIGDLEEVYRSIAEEKGVANACFWYRWQAFKSTISYIKNQFLWGAFMFKNYLLFTTRLIKRDKFHYFLNFIGLSIGIACSIIIMLFLKNELTYEHHHENADRIYRISSSYDTSGKPLLYATASPALGPRLREEYPEIEEFVRIFVLPEVLFKHADKRFYQQRIVFADPSIFKVFTYPLLQGDIETCLEEPNTIVLTEAVARKYFVKENPLGKIIQVENQDDLMVTGVIKDPPRNSHIPIEGIISYSSWDTDGSALNISMYEPSDYTFVLLPENYDLAAFYAKFPAFYEKYCLMKDYTIRSTNRSSLI